MTDEPVERYFRHALPTGAAPPPRAHVRMRGRIKVGAWLGFTAEQDIDSRAFTWRARVALGRLTVLRVVDRYGDGAGLMEGRLLGRVRVFRADGEDTARSAAGRAALEAATFAPHALRGDDRIEWRAESDDEIVATWDIGPERPEVHIRIDTDGAIRATWALRWRDGYVPCGCEVHAERRFGDLIVPSRVTVGWEFGTPRYVPFFRAELLALTAGDEVP